MEKCKIKPKRMEAARKHPDPEIAAFFKSRPPSYSHNHLYLELIIDMILSSNTAFNTQTKIFEEFQMPFNLPVAAWARFIRMCVFNTQVLRNGVWRFRNV